MLNVVLVGSLYSRNVGYVSRAMANMGADRLILINCKCDYNLEAREGAAGAQNHLLTATRYKSWSEFFANEKAGVRFAFSARQKKETDTLSFESRLTTMLKENAGGDSEKSGIYYLIFGPEDHGLSNEDLEFANYICNLPIFGAFKSLNLSHAVLIALYIFQTTISSASRAGSGLSEKAEGQSRDELFYFPQEAIREWLTTLGFKIGDRRIDAYKILKRILLSSRSTQKELRVLEAIVQQTVRKLKGDK